MSHMNSETRAITSIVDTAEEGDTILQIGSFRNCPLLRVSGEVLHENFRGFSVYNFEQTSPAQPFIFFNISRADYHAWVILMSIVHRRSDIPGDIKVTFSTLKDVAAHAARFQFRGGAVEEVEWVVTLLKQTLPKEHTHFPAKLSEDEAKETTSRIFDVLCIAYVFNLSGVFARASRQLMWIVKPEDLREGLVSDLGDVLNFDPDSDFSYEFSKANSRLRGSLMEYLPHIFFPQRHADELGTCFTCGSVPHPDRWYQVLTERSSHWEAELCGCERCEVSCANFSLHFDFSDMLTEMEGMRKDAQPEYPGCGQKICGRYSMRDPRSRLLALLNS